MRGRRRGSFDKKARFIEENFPYSKPESFTKTDNYQNPFTISSKYGSAFEYKPLSTFLGTFINAFLRPWHHHGQ